MKSAPLHPQERERLESLHELKILDTAIEAGYDELTELASTICQTPISLVTLIDEDRQWFKSRHGLEATQTPRELAFCAHVILQDEPLIVPDARDDERFHDNPLVTGAPEVIFYAGFPIGPDPRLPLGSFCVIDHEPRDLTPDQVDALRILARQVSTQLDLRRTLYRLEDARHEASLAARAKAQFLANMSHEIRTPMNGILGFTEILHEEIEAPHHQQMLTHVSDAGRLLLRVINDILDISKIEAGAIELEIGQTHLVDLVASTVETLGMTAARKDIELTLTSPYVEDARIMTDETRLRQILMNVIGNAIKFTDEGGTIQVRLELDRSSNQARVRIRDSGIGIPPDKLEHVFHTFSQADASITRRYGGTGLGLSISRQLARHLGGDLTLESEPGVGTEVTVLVTTGETPPPLEGPETASDGVIDDDPYPQIVKVLVVEDDDMGFQVTRSFLSKLGFEPRRARDGAEAVRMTGEIRPDLVLMDLQLPDVDGVTATRRIRDLEIPQPQIVALTARVLPEDRQACEDAGMNDFLTKPLVRKELEAGLGRASERLERIRSGGT